MHKLKPANKKAKKMVVVECCHFEYFSPFGISVKRIKDLEEYWVASLITSYILDNRVNIYISFGWATLLLEVDKGGACNWAEFLTHAFL